MHTVNFILKNNPSALTMVFKFHKAADDLYRKALNSISKIEEEDDFGCKLAIDMSEVVAVTFSEYEKDMDKNGDMQIIQHKSQLKTQSKARSDVSIQMMDSSLKQVRQ